MVSHAKGEQWHDVVESIIAYACFTIVSSVDNRGSSNNQNWQSNIQANNVWDFKSLHVTSNDSRFMKLNIYARIKPVLVA